MKKEYMTPQAEVVRFETEDVLLTASDIIVGGNGNDGGNEEGGRFDPFA